MRSHAHLLSSSLSLSSLSSLLPLLALFGLVQAQQAQLSVPGSVELSLRPGQVSTSYTLVSDNISDVSVVLSVCSPPAGAQLGQLTELSSTDALQLSTTGSAVSLDFGLAVASVSLADAPTVTVQAPAGFANASADSWRFELAVYADQVATLHTDAQRALNASLHGHSYGGEWPPVMWLEDTDDEAASLSVVYAATTPDALKAVVARADGLFNESLATPALALASCAIREAQATDVEANITTPAEPAAGFLSTDSQLVSRVTLDGLASNTSYVAWLARNDSSEVYAAPTFLRTKRGSSCALVTDVPSCPNVAYAAPAPSGVSATELSSFYESRVSTSLAAFHRTLSTFPCGMPDMGAYSFISTCDDCRLAYRDWLCATAIPRCTDAPLNATLNTDASGGLWDVPSTPQLVLVRDTPAASRTPQFGPANLSTTFAVDAGSPFPYSEVLPCTSLCELVAARCPPFLGWACPQPGGTGNGAYGVLHEVGTRDRDARDVAALTTLQEERERQGETAPSRVDGTSLRGQDRLGNVFCNSLGTDLTQAIMLSAGQQLAPVLSLTLSLTFFTAVYTH